MTDLVETHRLEIAELCRRYRVRTLELFGSGANGQFNRVTSDLDFLVDFLPLGPGERSKAYFGLWFGLEDLFQRKIDLVETGAIQNPYFLKSVNQSRTTLYAA